MLKKWKTIVIFVCFIIVCSFSAANIFAAEMLRMATTTSTDNSGLLDVILPPFEKDFNIKVAVIAVGTGKAIKLGENGDVDLILVHAPAAEEKFIAEGHGVNRRKVMHNDFIILGPVNDPAKINGLKSASKAFERISSTGSTFFSRGDDSGTHKKEKEIWEKAGLSPEEKWYLEAGQGMGTVLQMAHEKKGYTLSDRGTYLAYKSKIDLIILSEGDLNLHNPYGVMAVNPQKYPNTNYVKAMALIGWLTSPECQRMISEFKKEDEVLFYPDAVKK
jgi:tungstate transport system substrate-binding protein